MQTIVILPTYNERGNLKSIVQDILALDVPELGILIVDDNSPDGTGQIADDLADQHGQVSVLHREKKEGLGRAYVAGFRRALSDPAVQYIFEMDADHSHQPKYLPIFLQAAGSTDIVLGSRYVEGGGVENWHWSRHFISWMANSIIRIILGSSIRDLTGGYKCFRRSALERIDFEGVASRGYNFQIEMTYRASQQGLRIREIPITFIERRAGESKFNVSIMLESFWQVLKLRLRG